MIHSALALFAQRTRIPTSARTIGFCVIWVCISSSSSSSTALKNKQPIADCTFFILHLILNSLKFEEFLNVAGYLVHSSNLILVHISFS